MCNVWYELVLTIMNKYHSTFSRTFTQYNSNLSVCLNFCATDKDDYEYANNQPSIV